MKIRTKTWTPSVAMYSTKKKNSDKFTAAADHSLGLCPPQRKFGTDMEWMTVHPPRPVAAGVIPQ